MDRFIRYCSRTDSNKSPYVLKSPLSPLCVLGHDGLLQSSLYAQLMNSNELREAFHLQQINVKKSPNSAQVSHSSAKPCLFLDILLSKVNWEIRFETHFFVWICL